MCRFVPPLLKRRKQNADDTVIPGFGGKFYLMSMCTHHRFLFGFVLACAGAGAQTISVQSYGAIGNGSSDDTSALQNAINAAPVGSTIDFGSGKIYLVSKTILLKSHHSYSGSSTIRLSNRTASGSAVFSLRDTQPTTVSISGVALDGNFIGNAFIIDFATNTTALLATNITIQNVTVMNTVGQYAIYSPGTLDQSTISGNNFSNCTGGILVYSPDHITISNNHFDRITQDNAITVVYNSMPVQYGQSLTVSSNNGQNLGRMGLEIIGTGQTKAGSIAVSQNVFTDWLPSCSNSCFGMSIFTGTNAQITQNVVEGTGTVGIEIGAPGSLVQSNLVTDFTLGMTVEAPFVTIQNNRLLHNAQTGIYVTNSPYSKQSTIITNNYIADSQTIAINTSSANWEGSQVTGNTILRTPAWPGDQTGAFTGIGITPPLSSVSILSNNIILQTSTTAPSPSFIGIRINGAAGSNAQSRYDSNTIRSAGTNPQGIGVYGNSPGSLNGAIITNNGFYNLAMATDGASTQSPVTSGNNQYQCVQAGPINLFP